MKINWKPFLRILLLCLGLRLLLGLWMWGVRQLSNYIDNQLPPGHPVLSQVKPFLAHALRCAELRLMRMGMCDRPLSEMPRHQHARFLLAALRGKVTHSATRWFRKPTRLTDRYLNDPSLRHMLTEKESTRHMTH